MGIIKPGGKMTVSTGHREGAEGSEAGETIQFFRITSALLRRCAPRDERNDALSR